MGLCKGLCERLSPPKQSLRRREREIRLKGREIGRARQRAGGWALPRFGRRHAGAGGRPLLLSGPGDRASRGFKASGSFRLSGPGSLSRAKQPKEAGIKEGEKVLIWTAGDKTQSVKSLLALLLSWHCPSPAGSSEDRGFSSRQGGCLRFKVKPRTCEGCEGHLQKYKCLLPPQPRALKCSHQLKYCSPKHLNIVSQISLGRAVKARCLWDRWPFPVFLAGGVQGPSPFSVPGKMRWAHSKRAAGAGLFGGRQ